MSWSICNITKIVYTHAQLLPVAEFVLRDGKIKKKTTGWLPCHHPNISYNLQFRPYAKQVAKLIILYNSTKVDGKKIKPPLESYEKLKDEDTWQGEIEFGTKDQNNLEYFRRKYSKEKYEEIERVKREKSQREAELRDKKFQKMMETRRAASLK